MQDSPENAEPKRISRATMQEVLMRDSVKLVDSDEIGDFLACRSSVGMGQMILDFSSGQLEVTINTPDI